MHIPTMGYIIDRYIFFAAYPYLFDTWLHTCSPLRWRRTPARLGKTGCSMRSVNRWLASEKTLAVRLIVSRSMKIDHEMVHLFLKYSFSLTIVVYLQNLHYV